MQNYSIRLDLGKCPWRSLEPYHAYSEENAGSPFLTRNAEPAIRSKSVEAIVTRMIEPRDVIRAILHGLLLRVKSVVK